MSPLLILYHNAAEGHILKAWADGTVQPEMRARLHTVSRTLDPLRLHVEFEGCADWIDQELLQLPNRLELQNLCVVTDFFNSNARVEDLNPFGNDGWNTVLGMLILAFPEVCWLFVRSPPNDLKGACEAHFCPSPDRLSQSIASLSDDLVVLFDATRLRNHVREITRLSENWEAVKIRDKLAIAMDEEPNYSAIHAYIAYRFGFRAFCVTSFRGMCLVFDGRAESLQPDLTGRGGACLFKPDIASFSLEDIQLEYPDKIETLDLSDIAKRDARFPALAQINVRAFVTSGNSPDGSVFKHQTNATYFQRARRKKEILNISKPFGGMFDMWFGSGGLAAVVDNKEAVSQNKPRQSWFALACLYGRQLRDVLFGRANPEQRRARHAAPGRLLIIANRLIARGRTSRRLGSIPDLIRCAVLATDAQELLGNKSPTTALSALMLKQECEVLAECQFMGVQNHFDVKRRVEEIHGEVETISASFGPSSRHRRNAARNCEVSILSRLSGIFREHGKLDEDTILQGPIRTLHRKLVFDRLWTPLRVVSIVRWYADKLLDSFLFLVLAIIGWVVVMSVAFTAFDCLTLEKGLLVAVTTFFAMQPPPSDIGVWNFTDGWNTSFSLILLTMILGFVHLGIFISYLYSLISRR